MLRDPRDGEHSTGKGLESSAMAALAEQFQVLAAGDCGAIASLLEHSSMAHRFRLDTCSIHADIMASIDLVAPDLILVNADSTDLAGLEACRALKVHPATMMLPSSWSASIRICSWRHIPPEPMTSWSPPVRTPYCWRGLRRWLRAGSRRRKIAATARNTDERRGEELQATFRRYVSPQLADRILDNTRLRDSILTAADIRTRAVVMFADLRGFTSIAERLSPYEVVPLLNQYFSLLTEITFQHEGTVFHMAGDCLMVGFGVPFEQPDSPERAVRAAREMLDRFALLADSCASATISRRGLESASTKATWSPPT